MQIPFVSKFFQKPLPPSSDEASAEDKERLAKLGSKLKAEIVFDSNRSGTFGIYRMQTGNSVVNAVVDSEKHEIYPDTSPNGQWIVFAKAETTARTSPADIWIVRPDGSDAKLIAKDGTFPTFSGDGQTVYFERDRNKAMAVDVSGENLREIFPAGNKEFGSSALIKPRVSPDSRYLAFISDKKGRWNTWYVDLRESKLLHLEKGCEPTWYPDSERVAWIKTGGVKDGSGLYTFDTNNRNVTVLQDGGPPRGHEYFPTISRNGDFLLYSSCREGEHSHIDANYQLFIKDLQTNELTRVTFDQHTNRWPKLLVR